MPVGPVVSQSPTSNPHRSRRSRSAAQSGSPTLPGSSRVSALTLRASACQRAVASRSITSQRPWIAASVRLLPPASPLLETTKPPPGGWWPVRSAWIRSCGSQMVVPEMRSSAAVQAKGRYGSMRLAPARGRDSRTSAAHESANSAGLAWSTGRRTCSAWWSSAASTRAEAVAAAEAESLSLGDRHRAGVRPAGHDDRNPDPIEPRDVGEPGDAPRRHEGSEAPDRLFGRDESVRALLPELRPVAFRGDRLAKRARRD